MRNSNVTLSPMMMMTTGRIRSGRII